MIIKKLEVHTVEQHIRDRALTAALMTTFQGESASDVLDRAQKFADFLMAWPPAPDGEKA